MIRKMFEIGKMFECTGLVRVGVHTGGPHVCEVTTVTLQFED